MQVFDHPDRPGFKLVASPFRIGEPLPAKPAPKLGEHNEEIKGGAIEAGASKGEDTAKRSAD